VLRSTTWLGGPFEEALRALGLPYEVRGSGATAATRSSGFSWANLESLRKPDDPDAFEGALSSSLGGVGARTLSRLRAHARDKAAADTGRAPLCSCSRPVTPCATAALGGEPPTEVSSSLTTRVPLRAELDSCNAAMVARHRLLGRGRGCR